ncbi:Rv3654c family TadE-like protein [Ornithinimicrobium sediminis]|uniref:Rv3654c family TadE-like protein n=1 Tax=Ornithinimicrobium sediminis TaxID=2904603 RepID=UPI001E5DD289|nr:hypothetical protein [Ornithinimicrobium sediminis]
MSGTGSDRGAASVLGLALVAVLVTVLLAGLMVGAALTAGQRARTAADLGTVAGGQELLRGAPEHRVCARVAALATANGAQLVACELLEAGPAGAGGVGGAEVGPRVWAKVRVATGVPVVPWAHGTAVAGLVPLSP